MIEINGDKCHDRLIKQNKPKMTFGTNADYIQWKQSISDKARELLCLDKIAENACDKHWEVESTERCNGYTKMRIVVETEKDNYVPCNVLIPDTGKSKYPVAITLQGHMKGGMYHSVGETRCDKDKDYQPQGAFALQAVENGYVAVTVELRGMGELEPSTNNRMWGDMCKYTASVALLTGRVLLGERIWDIMRVIDVLEDIEQVDTDNICITGNSGGGTLSFYTGCFDSRIKVVAPSCAFCPFEESILEVYHCICNYVPHAFEYYEMYDLACMIAPRKLVVIAGQKDIIFPIDGVRRGMEIVKEIFRQQGCENNVTLIETPFAHYWSPEHVWPAINKAMNKAE